MEFFFTKNDSLYQIFKLLEKLPSWKAVEIFIDPEHGFFENPRWGKQVKEIIDKRKLNITFKTKKEINRQYYLQVGLKVNYQEEKKIMKVISIIRLFFTDIRKFHLQAFDKQRYLFFLVFSFEILAGVLLLWFMFSLIMPKATITIHTAQQSENIIYNFRYYPKSKEEYLGAIKQISIPYSTGSIKYKYELSIGTTNLQYIQNPSRGLVSIYNKTDQAITLLPKTRFVTSDKLVFVTDWSITLPSGTEQSPSEIKVVLYASEEDEEGNIMGARGNIEKGSNLLVRNLKESFYLKNIRAESLEAFTGWTSSAIGSVKEEDTQLLKERIKETVYADKLNIVQKNFRIPNTMVLMFDPLISTTFESINTDTEIWSSSPEVKGHTNVRFSFLYLSRDDVFDAFKRYIYERQSDNRELISIDRNSFAFIEQPSYLVAQEVFMIPTKMTILQGYDFQRDTKGIIPELKNKIIGEDINSARRTILEYPEVGSVDIEISSFWGNTIPTIKSRVKIKVTK